nr:hypothetical protein [Tanacetum cinerariifolium]
MNGWVDDDDDDVEEEKVEENEDADMEEDDDTKIIFPYEVQGDQTPPPRDESSDSDSEPEAEEADDEPEAEDADDELEAEDADDEPEAEDADVELEAEEPDGVPEAVIGAGSQRPFAIRDFPIGVYETGEHERIRDAESETGRTEVALLGSEAKIGKMEREILHHDLSSVEETLGNADGTGVRGTGPIVPELTGCTYATFIKCDPLPFIGTEGAVLEDPEMDIEERIMPPKPMSEARMREIIRDQFATSMNEFMADMNSRAGGPGGASGSGGAGGSGGTGGNANGTGVRGTGPTVP